MKGICAGLGPEGAENSNLSSTDIWRACVRGFGVVCVAVQTTTVVEVVPCRLSASITAHDVVAGPSMLPC